MSALCRNLGRNQGWLTGRERDVLNGLLSGQSNKEIARKHGLSEVTIKHHLKSLRSKLGARNRTQDFEGIELGVAEDSQGVLQGALSSLTAISMIRCLCKKIVISRQAISDNALLIACWILCHGGLVMFYFAGFQ